MSRGGVEAVDSDCEAANYVKLTKNVDELRKTAEDMDKRIERMQEDEEDHKKDQVVWKMFLNGMLGQLFEDNVRVQRVVEAIQVFIFGYNFPM